MNNYNFQNYTQLFFVSS